MEIRLEHADLFEKRAERGGNRIPRAHLAKFSLRYGSNEPDDFDQMPPHMQRFVRSITT